MFILYPYKNVKSGMGTTAGRGHFRVTAQDRMWVPAVKAGGSEGKG